MPTVTRASQRAKRLGRRLLRDAGRPPADAPDPLAFHSDPLGFRAAYWPDVVFYAKQEEICRSVVANVETVIVAGNQLGKDFVGGFLVVWAFCSHPVARIITTSAREDHLAVLWAEIGWFLNTAKWPLPVVELHQELRKPDEASARNARSYAKGLVASAGGEGLAGHHAPYTLAMLDEASGVPDVAYKQMQGWAKRVACWGNPNPCAEEHFFRRAVEGGDLE